MPLIPQKKESFFMLHAVLANQCVVFLKGAPNLKCRLSSTTAWVLDVVYFYRRYVSIYVTGPQATFVLVTSFFKSIPGAAQSFNRDPNKNGHYFLVYLNLDFASPGHA